MQARDKARDEMLFKEQLSEAQQKELDSLRQQVSGSGFGELDPSEDLADAWVDIDLESNAGSDDGRQAEAAVVEELTLPSNSSAWSNRLTAEHEAWTAQLPDLCDAYLSYRSGITLSESMEVDESGSCVTLQCICISGFSPTAEISKTFPLVSPDSWVNATLIRHGFLAPSPSRPTVAISLELLEILAAVQRRAPSASVEALSKAFCDLRNSSLSYPTNSGARRLSYDLPRGPTST
ncbi:hypothetical protein FRC09_018861 [Ceratobasidium sp. 395]|nr:hypothetical protein FRC09_018861 [Ceratobasidium sp. 395]